MIFHIAGPFMLFELSILIFTQYQKHSKISSVMCFCVALPSCLFALSGMCLLLCSRPISSKTEHFSVPSPRHRDTAGYWGGLSLGDAGLLLQTCPSCAAGWDTLHILHAYAPSLQVRPPPHWGAPSLHSNLAQSLDVLLHLSVYFSEAQTNTLFSMYIRKNWVSKRSCDLKTTDETEVQLSAGKCLTTGSLGEKKVLICSTGWCPGCKYFYPGQPHTTNVTLLKMDLGREAYSCFRRPDKLAPAHLWEAEPRFRALPGIFTPECSFQGVSAVCQATGVGTLWTCSFPGFRGLMATPWIPGNVDLLNRKQSQKACNTKMVWDDPSRADMEGRLKERE